MFSQLHLDHHCTLDFMIPASCPYHPAATNPKLVLTTFQSSSALMMHLLPLLLKSSGYIPYPKRQIPAVVQSLCQVLQSMQQKKHRKRHPTQQVNSSFLLSCLWSLTTYSLLPSSMGLTKKQPSNNSHLFQGKCSAQSGIIKPEQ